MKRHPDLEREILLAIEADERDGLHFADLSDIKGFTRQQIGYHVLLLHEAGLVDAIDATTMNHAYDWLPKRLTMDGHQYLDTIRDPEIWRKTKEGAEKAGSFSLEVLSAIAKGVIREQVKKLSGVEIDL